jgi:hypothetical protein
MFFFLKKVPTPKIDALPVSPFLRGNVRVFEQVMHHRGGGVCPKTPDSSVFALPVQ